MESWLAACVWQWISVMWNGAVWLESIYCLKKGFSHAFPVNTASLLFQTRSASYWCCLASLRLPVPDKLKKAEKLSPCCFHITQRLMNELTNETILYCYLTSFECCGIGSNKEKRKTVCFFCLLLEMFWCLCSGHFKWSLNISKERRLAVVLLLGKLIWKGIIICIKIMIKRP